MKNKAATSLILLLIFTVLTSCIADVNNISESSGENTSEETEISEPVLTQTVYHEKLFDCFKDKSVAELEEMFNKNRVNTVELGYISITNTPIKVLFKYNKAFEQGDYITYSYNKQSGTVTYACQDPLCDYSNCIFGYDYEYSFYSSDYLYIICNSSYEDEYGNSELISQETIYRTDASGNNPEKLYDTYCVMWPSCFNGCFYFAEVVLDENGKSVYRLVEIDKAGDTRYVSPEGLSIVDYTINNDGIYYVNEADFSLYFTADRFKTSRKLIDNVGYFAVTDSYLFYNYNYTSGKEGLYRSSVDGTDEMLVSMSAKNTYYNNGYFYYVKFDNLNEMWRIKSDGTDNELMFVSETNGQPDELFLRYLIDGSLCYTYCSTCVDEDEAVNYFGNPQVHFAVYDMTTGEKFLIDPDF